ncbi:MAG: hypothetical protein AAGB22_09105 [Bacteroidota bacterium]
MSEQRYRYQRGKRKVLRKEDIARHQDFPGLLEKYQKATRPLYRRPLYKDPKTFLALLAVLLVMWLLLREAEREEQQATPPADTTQVAE